MPWSPGSALFVALSAALLGFFRGTGVPGVVGSYFLLSWLFKYAFVVLEHVANGRLEAPAVSVEMLGPFERRPMILAAWCLALVIAARTLGGAAGVALTTVGLMVLPAIVAVLGLGWGVLQSINPLTLWRTIRGLGIYYLGALGLMAATAVLIFILGIVSAWDAWNLCTIALAEVAVLTLFSALGGALFVRRQEIGHEPTVSPERRLAQEDREHLGRLNAMLDELYTQAQLKKHELAMGVLRRWFAHSDDRRIVSDGDTIIARIATWHDSRILSRVSQALGTELEQRGFPGAAADIRRRAPE